MKHIKKFFLCLLTIASIMSLVSCGDDDDSTTSSNHNLFYGTWKITKVTYNGTEFTQSDEQTIEFCSNNTFLSEGDTGTFTWQGDNQISLTSDGKVLLATIDSLTSTNMVISFTGEAWGQNGSWKLYMEKVSNPNNNNYQTLILGTWNATSHIVDGVTTQHEMAITFNSNGSGIISDEGVTENNDFTYIISGSTIIVTPTHGEGTVNYTITTLTSTNLVISGTSMPCYENNSYIGYYTKSTKKK